MNRESSRSHLIMSIVIESTNLQTQNVTKGKLSFVDLAGSERYGHDCCVTSLWGPSCCCRAHMPVQLHECKIMQQEGLRLRPSHAHPPAAAC